MLTQVLILHGQLAFAIALKQGLERSNRFEVHPFLSVDAALDYLREHVQDVALVDFTITEMYGAEVVRRFREIQADIAVVVTPNQSADVINALGLQATLDTKFTVRELAPLLRDLFKDGQRPSEIWEAELPRAPTRRHVSRARAMPSAPLSPPPPPPGELPEVASLEHILANMGDVFQPGVSEETPVDEETSAMWQVERREADLFDEVLNSLPQDEGGEPRRSDPFSDLVNSMRSDEPHQPLPTRRQDYVEFVFNGGLESLFEQIDNVTGSSKPVESTPQQDESSRTFEKLAREEPPRLTLEDSGTINDLIMGVEDPSFHNVLALLRGETLPPLKPQAVFPEQQNLTPPPTSAPPVREEYTFEEPESSESSESSPAKAILAQALEQSVSQEGFSLEELLSNIERQLPRHRPRVQPLPSWIRESQSRADSGRFMTSEPDFLPEVLPDLDVEADTPQFEPEADDFASQFIDQLTIPSAAQPIESLPEETQWLEAASVHREQPSDLPEQAPDDWQMDELPPEFDELPPHAPDEDTQSYTKPYTEPLAQASHPRLPQPMPPEDLPEFPTFVTENFNTSFELLAAFEVVDDRPRVEDRYNFTVGRVPIPPVEAPVPSPAADDPRIAQLALSLTEVSLELTAEATLLTRAGELVAFAGQLAEDEILELRPFIPMDSSSIPSGSYIRFVSATDSPKNYMLYSARTDDELILSLVFSSTTPLRDIRRQGARLAEALRTTPEPAPVEIEFPKPLLTESLEIGTRTPYTFVWLVDNPTSALEPKVSQAIQSALRVQLGERGWLIHDLRVEEDYLYLLADVPGETMPYEIIRDLKRRSAEIAHKQNPDPDPDLLWSDGYLVVAPGRSLDVDEIQQFINFERMG